MSIFQIRNKSGTLFFMFFVVGVLSLFWGVSNAFAECSDNDGGDDPYTMSTYPSATADSFLALTEQREACRADGTQSVVREIYCDSASGALAKTYYCDSCSPSPTVCLEESEVTVTDVYEDADGSDTKIKTAVSRYTEVVETATGTMISSGHYQSCVDSCDTKSPGKVKECQVVAGALVQSTLYCPKGLTCSDGACK